MKYFVHIVTLVFFQVISKYLKLQTSCFKLSDSIKQSHHECETSFIKITKDTSFPCNKSAKSCTSSSWRSISCTQHKHGKVLWSCLLPRSVTFTLKLDSFRQLFSGEFYLCCCVTKYVSDHFTIVVTVQFGPC